MLTPNVAWATQITRYVIDTLKFGGPGAIRTHDPFLRREVLYPAELRVRLGRPFSWKMAGPQGW